MTMTPDTVQSSPTPAPAVSKPKKNHWARRIIFAIIALSLLIALIVQIVLRTDVPRGIVVSQIEKQLGLRLTVKTLTTGWLGHTQLNDVTIGLPLSDKAFLNVPTMKVKNTSLFGLLLGRPVAVEAIELDQPHLYVWQDSSGQWNLQQVADLLARAGGQKSGEASAATSSTPQMPNVHLTGGVITIVDNKNRTVDVEPLTVDGYADTGVSWKYDVEIAPSISITGRLVPGGDWAHEIAAKIQNVGQWAKPWTSDFPDMTVDVSWRGQLNATGVDGRLDIHQITAGDKAAPVEAYGSLTAEAGSAGVAIHPDNLLLKTGIAAVPDLRLASGLIHFDPATRDLKIEQLLVAVFGGSAKVGGSYNLNTSAAQIEAVWEKLALPRNILHSGKLAVTLSKPFPDKIIVDGNLVSTGTQGPAAWLFTTGFGATGTSIADFDWKVDTHQVQWQRHVQGINLDNLHLAGGLHNGTVSLASIGLPDKDLLSGTASYQLKDRHAWQAHLEGQHWPFKLIPGTQLGFAIHAEGDNQHIAVNNFVLKSPDAVISANAIYKLGDPKPLNLNLTITNAPPAQAPAAVASNTPAKILNGTIDGHASIRGTLDPVDLEVRGGMNGREIDVRGYHIGTLAAVLANDSHINSDGVFVGTESLNLFGGKWNIDGIYDPDWNDVQVNVAMTGASLKEMAAVVDQQNIAGTLSGRLSIAVPGLNFDLRHLRVPPSTFTLDDINVHGIAVDQIKATMSLASGQFEINPIHFKRAEGSGDVRIAADLNHFRQISGSAKIVSWPVDITGAQAHIDAWVDVPSVVVNLPDAKSLDPARQRFGIIANQIDVHASTTLKGEKLGDLEAHAGIDDRALDIRAVHMRVLGGRLDGQAHARLDNLLGSTGEFTWQDLDLHQLGAIFPQIDELNGTITGNARLAPTNVPRPREPLALVITTQFNDGHWRTLPIKDLRLATYLGPVEKEVGGGWRIVMEDSKLDPSFIHAADGTVEIWGRSGFHGRASSSQMQCTFKDLDLNQLRQALDPSASQTPGRVAGSILLIRAPLPTERTGLPTHRMFPGRPDVFIQPVVLARPNDPPLKKLIDPIYAEGNIVLSQTSLAKAKPFAFLNNLGKSHTNAERPIGTGDVQFHLERGVVSIEHLHYFYSGTETRAVGTLSNIWKGKESNLNATITLTDQPLRSVKLPFFSDLNTAFVAIQRGLTVTAIRVDGTPQKLKITQLGISELGEQMRALLVSDAKGNGGN